MEDSYFDAVSSPIEKSSMVTSSEPTALQRLNTTHAKELNQLMKELERIGVGHIIDLPRIVVYGGQNAGKSSVLEAISRIPFPVEHGLCTRFATELDLEDADTKEIEASVRYADEKKKLKELEIGADIDKKNGIADIIRKAASVMDPPGSGKQFYNDVLELNIKMPGQPSLRMVDLPGVFTVSNEEQLPADMQTVNELVESYLKRKNSIIMLVLSSDYDFVHQSILRDVMRYEGYRDRTIGIITKPDISEARKCHKDFIALAQNKQRSCDLRLGWHVLRNRDTEQGEFDFEARDRAEIEFFTTKRSTTPSWLDVGRHNWGVKALRERLSIIQFNHQRRCFPAVTKDIREHLDEREEMIRRMGTKRSTPEDMREFLHGKAVEFRMLAKSALEGHYNEPFFRRHRNAYNLRSQIRNLNDVLAFVMMERGAKSTITRATETTPPPPTAPAHVEDLLKKHPYPIPYPTECSFESVSADLARRSASHRALELPGAPNEALAVELFQEESAKWEPIAKYHIKLVISCARNFVKKAFEFLIGPVDTTPTTDVILRTKVHDFFKEREHDLNEKLKELLQPYKAGFAIPTNEEFLAEMRSITSQTTHRPETGFASTDIIVDKMEAYYVLSRRTFTDNVVNLAVEACLVRRIESIFTTEMVRKMKDPEIIKIAAESESVRDQRKLLEKEKDILERALDFCTRHEPYNDTDQEHFIPQSRETTEPDTLPSPPDNISASTKAAPATKTSKPSENAITSAPEHLLLKPKPDTHSAPTPPESDDSSEPLPSAPKSDSPPASAASSARGEDASAE